MKDPARIVRYVSTVLDGGEVPQFSITADDAPDEPIIRTSASQAWNIVSKGISLVIAIMLFDSNAME